MNNLLFILFAFQFFTSTVDGIACYKHDERCLRESSCLIDAHRKNCSSPHDYCFKDDGLFGLAIRGCTELKDCNATLALYTRHCCDTDYCNHGVKAIGINGIMMITMLMTIITILQY